MKRLTFGLMLFGSCSITDTKMPINTTKQEIAAPLSAIDKNIRSYILARADDPDSYKPISTYIVDTIFFIDNIKKAIRDCNLGYERGVDIYKRKFDSLLVSNNPKSIAAYKYIHKFRIKNKFGALALNEYIVESDAKLGILTMYDINNRGKRLIYPGGFPK